eukprot:4538709-Amphidinium_carterae.3
MAEVANENHGAFYGNNFCTVAGSTSSGVLPLLLAAMKLSHACSCSMGYLISALSAQLPSPSSAAA